MSESKATYGDFPRPELVELQQKVIQLAREVAGNESGCDLRNLFNAVFFNLRGIATPCPKESLRRLGEEIAAHPDRAELWDDMQEHYEATVK